MRCACRRSQLTAFTTAPPLPLFSPTPPLRPSPSHRPPAEISARARRFSHGQSEESSGQMRGEVYGSLSSPSRQLAAGIQPDVAMDTSWPTATEDDAQSPLVGICIQSWHKACSVHTCTRLEGGGMAKRHRDVTGHAGRQCSSTEWPRLAFTKNNSAAGKTYNVKARERADDKTEVF